MCDKKYIYEEFLMANHKSAAKRARQTIKITERNRFYKTRMKNIVKAVHEAVEAQNIETAEAALKIANAKLHKFVTKGLLKKNTAARKVSRLTKLVRTIEAAA